MNKFTLNYVFVLLLLQISIVVPARSEGPSPELLTVPQTVGSVFMGVDDTKQYLHIATFAKANPEARENIYRLLDSGELGVYTNNAFFILSFLNKEKEAIYLEERLKMYRDADIGPIEIERIGAAAIALGNMSRLGNKRAGKVLSTIANRGYWNHDGNDVKTNNAILKEIPVEDIVLRVLLGVAGSGIQHKREIIKRYIDDLPQAIAPETTKYLKYRASFSEMEKYWIRFAESASKPVPRNVRLILPMLFNGDLDSPERQSPEAVSENRKPQGNEKPKDHALAVVKEDLDPQKKEQLSQEAEAAFLRIRHHVIEDNLDAVKTLLLDDGEPFSDKRLKEKSFEGELREAIVLQRDILLALEENESGLKMIEVRRGRDGGYIVKLAAEESESIAEKFDLRTAKSRTVSEDGRLVVCMYRFGEAWRWNPFGW